jgi:pimeloyl-ACP methyl ester carboxylesterase
MMDKRLDKWMAGLLFVLAALVASLSPMAAGSTAQQIQGAWQGKLVVPGGSLRVVFHITARADGTLTATMDSPDQGATGIPVSAARMNGAKVVLEVAAAQGRYEGTLSPPDKMAGTWSQRGMTFPLDLERVDKPAEVRRPQEPKPPFPYLAEEVTVPNTKAGITLAGTLTLPKGAGPFPAALLITGSGPENRDEAIFGHKPFLVLADSLTRRGIAVLRLDDRGVGKSTGDFAKALEGDFVEDALAAVSYLRTRKEVDPKRIGLIGHSEGALIAARAATESPDVAFVVMLEGPGVPCDQILYRQAALMLEAAGAGKEAVAAKHAEQEQIFAILRKERDDDAAAKQILEVLKRFEPAGTPEKALEAYAKNVVTPWFRRFIDLDPRITLKKVKCPVLAVGGSRDLQVPPEENLKAIEEALKAGGNTRVTIKELPGLNHLLQTAETGLPAEYSTIEETMAPEALKLVGDWILSTGGSK